MSKSKSARFRLRKGETLVKSGSMDYCLPSDGAHSKMGTAYLTDERFYFWAEYRRTGEYVAVEIPLEQIERVGKKGVPLISRRIHISAGGEEYRFGVFPMGGWLKAIGEAVERARVPAEKT